MRPMRDGRLGVMMDVSDDIMMILTHEFSILYAPLVLLSFCPALVAPLSRPLYSSDSRDRLANPYATLRPAPLFPALGSRTPSGFYLTLTFSFSRSSERVSTTVL